MVEAILEGRKSQTRRIIHPQPDWGPWRKASWQTPGCVHIAGHREAMELVRELAWKGKPLKQMNDPRCPYGVPGDRLWVKEPFRLTDRQGCWMYYPLGGFKPAPVEHLCDWKRLYRRHAGSLRGPMFMPRWASRLTLEVVRTRVERLQDIAAADARAEGMGGIHVVEHFRAAWEQSYGDGAWAANPWVWVVEFRIGEGA